MSVNVTAPSEKPLNFVHLGYQVERSHNPSQCTIPWASCAFPSGTTSLLKTKCLFCCIIFMSNWQPYWQSHMHMSSTFIIHSFLFFKILVPRVCSARCLWYRIKSGSLEILHIFALNMDPWGIINGVALYATEYLSP